jgi:hypothetical protein
MCVQTAELYVEPPNDVDIEMSVSKKRNGKHLDMIKSQPSCLKREEKSSRR